MSSDTLFDTLSGLAPLLRVRPEVHSLCRVGANWKCDHNAESSPSARFHIVTSGTCVIELSGVRRSLQVSAGDVVVLPRGAPHILRSPRLPSGELPFAIPTDVGDGDAACDNAREPQTELVSGRLHFEQAHRNLVLSALPDAIVIATSDGPDADRMRRLITAIRDEIESARAGVNAIASDLASALFVMAVRVHLEREQAANGLLGLLAHRQAGRAVMAMLEDLSRPWTLNALAACANASRASLVRMFQKFTQTPPLEFLYELRLELARRKLATSRLPLGEIAAEIGYQSESAFSRAFRRRFGIPPGEARINSAERTEPSRRQEIQTKRARQFMPARALAGRRASANVAFRDLVSLGT